MPDVETSMIVGAGSSGVTGMLVRLLQMWRSVDVSMGFDPLQSSVAAYWQRGDTVNRVSTQTLYPPTFYSRRGVTLKSQALVKYAQLHPTHQPSALVEYQVATANSISA